MKIILCTKNKMQRKSNLQQIKITKKMLKKKIRNRGNKEIQIKYYSLQWQKKKNKKIKKISN